MRPSTLIPALALVASLLLLLAFTRGALPRDLWWDELTSLNGFALTDFTTTLTGRSGLNNHVLFNLFDNALTRILGRRDLWGWMGDPAPLRIAQVLVAAVTVSATFAYATRAFGATTGALTALLLVTTTPFLSFATQLRGYNLAMCFAALTLLAGHAWYRHRGPVRFAALTACLFGLLYALLSNAYVVAAFVLMATARAFAAPTTPREVARRAAAGGLAAAALAIGLAAVAYRPTIGALLADPFLTRAPESRGFVLTTTLPGVLVSFLSLRLVLLVPWIAGCALALRNVARNRERWGEGAVLAGVFLLPFVFSAVRNDLPFPRTFVVLAPVFAVLLAAPIGALLDRGIRDPRIRSGCVVAVGAVCVVAANADQRRARDVVDAAYDRGERVQRMSANFYQSERFQPAAAADLVAGATAVEPLPVVLHAPVDRISSALYLARVGVTSYAFKGVAPAPGNGAGSRLDVQIVSGEPESRGAIAFASVPVDLTRYPVDLHELGPVLLAAAEREGNRGGFYVLTSSARELELTLRDHLGDTFTFERLNETPLSTDVYRLRRRAAPE